jgi:dolichol kinase
VPLNTFRTPRTVCNMVLEPEPPDAHLEPAATAEIEALELFRRSPHPYQRRKHELRNLQGTTGSSRNDYSRITLHPSDRTLSDEDGSNRRKTSQSPSESGTEADDEGYGFIKALPAPPLRLHKGLRSIRAVDSGASPLLTPSLVDEEGRKVSDYFRPRKGGPRHGDMPSPTDAEAKAARQKYLKRRHAEVIRRTNETALLGAITLLAVRGCGCWEQLLPWYRGWYTADSPSSWHADKCSADLLTHALVMAGVLALYPVRLLYYSWRREPPSLPRLRQRIRIPAAFDPAPILYPAILPVVISISLFSSSQKSLPANIILGLAALPPQLVPYGTSPLGYSTLHWLLCILPLVVSENTDIPSKISATLPYKLKLPPPDQGLHPEILVALFPLHQALLPPLHYLTTTSLLPAELHLLSIALINLLLFAESPQADIIRTLLWVGGLGVFVLCGQVLKWGVALARIPKWRFRHAGHIIKARQSFLQSLNQTLKPDRSSSASRVIEESDADEDDFIIKNSLIKTRSLKLNIVDAMKRSTLENGGEIQSAVEPKDPNGKAAVLASPPRRRNTLPNLTSQNRVPQQTVRHRRRAKSVAQSFLALTPTQATVRKWLYAAYFYFIVVALILVPIRYMIGRQALNDNEPFGWAIGYLFGNIQRLRFEVFVWDLNSWIALPALSDSSDTLLELHQRLPTIEFLRNILIGPANLRLLLCAYCAGIIAIGLAVVLSITFVEVDTRRKVFHGMMVAMLLPTIFIDPCFISLALALVLAIFLLLDLIRASQLPPLSGPIASFLTPYVDGRDLRGPVVVSHIFLLIGCAIPLWLSLAGVGRTGEDPWVGWDVESRDVSMIAGVVCVGMGDAAASLIGRRYGQRKWPWAGGKSLEGSLAFALAVMIGLTFGKIWLEVGWDDGGWRQRGLVELAFEAGMVLGKAAVCAFGASFEEAVLTGGNDNVVVPVVLWVLVRGVRL